MPHKDPEARRAYMRQWKEMNADRNRWLNKLADAAIHANGRARKYGCDGVLTAQDIRECFAEGSCFYCGESPEMLTVDHVTPLHLGGPNVPANIVPACRSCNISKFRGDRPGRWSRRHDECVDCGRSDVRHAARGQCITCYSRQQRAAS